MAKVYYDLIKAGYRTIEQVPLTWRAAVQALLDADKAEPERPAEERAEMAETCKSGKVEQETKDNPGD